jgi:hypothetical protein
MANKTVTASGTAINSKKPIVNYVNAPAAIAEINRGAIAIAITKKQSHDD